MRRIAAALLVCLAACSSTPSTPTREVSLERADTEFLAGNYSRAGHLYEEALPMLAPERRAATLVQVGKCRLGSGDADGAIQSFGEALTATSAPELRCEIHYRRAAAYSAGWHPVEALADLCRVRDAGASTRATVVRTEEYLYRLGVTTLRTGDWKNGKAALAELIQKFPASREAADARDRAAMSDFRVQIGRVREPKADALRSASGDWIVCSGRFARFTDAVREMERLRKSGYPDAFVIP